MNEIERLYGFKGIPSMHSLILRVLLNVSLIVFFDRLQEFPLNDQRPIRLFILFYLHRLLVPPKMILDLLFIYRHSFSPFTVDLVHAIGL